MTTFKHNHFMDCLRSATDSVMEESSRKLSDLSLVAMYNQLHETPALGFLGVAACKETVAYTTVFSVTTSDEYFVCFDGRFCYKVVNPNEEFFKDVTNGTLVNIIESSKYNTVQTDSESESGNQSDE